MRVKDWLEYRWRRDNHTKYRHLFKEWYSNVLPYQLEAFEHQMHNDINKVLYG